MHVVRLLSLLTSLYALHMLLKNRQPQAQRSATEVLYDHEDLLFDLNA